MRPSYLFLASFVPQITPSKIFPFSTSTGQNAARSVPCPEQPRQRSASRCAWHLVQKLAAAPKGRAALISSTSPGREGKQPYPASCPETDCTTSLHPSYHQIPLATGKMGRDQKRETLEARRVPSHLHFSSVSGVTSGFM